MTWVNDDEGGWLFFLQNPGERFWYQFKLYINMRKKTYAMTLTSCYPLAPRVSIEW